MRGGDKLRKIDGLLKVRKRYRRLKNLFASISGIAFIIFIGFAGASDTGNIDESILAVAVVISILVFAVFATLGYIFSQYEKDCRRHIRYLQMKRVHNHLPQRYALKTKHK